MNISLIKAGLKDVEMIYAMQLKSFSPLLEKYQDFDTSPANEPAKKTVARIKQTNTDYYIIQYKDAVVGGIRILKREDKRYKVGPVFILPEYQGQGIAQEVFHRVEFIYADAEVWELDTILQEQGNCYLYEKLGYKKIGKTETVNDKMTIVFYEKHFAE